MEAMLQLFRAELLPKAMVEVIIASSWVIEDPGSGKLAFHRTSSERRKSLLQRPGFGKACAEPSNRVMFKLHAGSSLFHSVSFFLILSFVVFEKFQYLFYLTKF